jgi:hypothetical protein
VSFIGSLIALCQYMIAASAVRAEGVLYGLYVIIGNALQPEATVMTVVCAVDAVRSAGTVVIVVASTAKSYRRIRRAHEAP